MLRNLEGEWLNERYIDQLKRSRSLTLASEEKNPAIQIHEENGRYYLREIIAFHESIETRIEDMIPEGQNTWRLALEPIEDATEILVHNFSVERKNCQESLCRKLRILLTNDVDAAFEKVEKGIKAFQSSIVISGQYYDNIGNLFGFEDSGRAVWFGEPVWFEIFSDQEIGCDLLSIYYHEKDRGRSDLFFFRNEGGVIKIFRLERNNPACEEKDNLYLALVRR
jgi:hypothetical protein